MPIRFSIARRGVLPTEGQPENTGEATGGENRLRPSEAKNRLRLNEVKNLRVLLESPQTTDVIDFQTGSSRLPSVLPKAELTAALSILQRVMVHEFEKGNAVALPGIGTFRLSLKGGVEVKDGSCHGKDVRIDSILFRPDGELLKEVRRFEVNQVPYGWKWDAGEPEVATRLAELFAAGTYITHRDVSVAFGQTLTRSRVTSLLQRLVREGRLIREGKGAQTRYRLA